MAVSATLSQGFPKGYKARAFLRASDSFSPGQAVVAQTTVGDDGQVKLTGLDDGVQYFVQVTDKDGNQVAVRAVQAKGPDFNEDASLHRVGPEATGRRLQADREAQAAARAKAEKTNPLVASPAPGATVVDNSPERRSPLVPEPQPGPRQQETSGPQRSDTPDGEGTPKDPKEHVPQVPQEAIGASTPQRSHTETGAAAVKDPKEAQPAARQEDVPASTSQRSATETGQAEPKPKVRGTDVKERADSSASQARGRTAPKSEENVVPKGTVKQTTRTGTPKRSSNKSK